MANENIPQLTAEELEILRAGAERKEPYYLHTYGKVHFYGQGVEKDVAKAMALFEEAAKQNHTGGNVQHRLSLLYSS